MHVARPKKSCKQLSNAIHDDITRQAIDDAKKRAVNQRVDYETFKNMVSVAHLKPLQAASTRKDDFLAPGWTFNADGERPPEHTQPTVCPTTSSTPFEPPTSHEAFLKCWKRRCKTPEDKLAFLKLCGPELLGIIFRVEITPGILTSVIEALDWGRESQTVDPAFVEAVFRSLSGAGRFSLTIKCLSASTKNCIRAFIEWIENKGGRNVTDLRQTCTI